MTSPQAILFDMDGTLTEPMLDFPRIKAEMGIGRQSILEAMAGMNAEARTHCETILHRHEDEAARHSTLNPGCREVLDWCERRNIHTAVITRNSRRNCELVMAKHRLVFHHLVTRDDGAFKPDPMPLLLACARLGIKPQQAWMVGDGSHDIEAGNAAGIPTVWISHGRQREFDAEPWKTVNGLVELLDLLNPERS